jgi:BON domain
VTVRSRSLLAAAAGLLLAAPLLGQEPARLGVEPGPALTPSQEPSANQKLANTVADHLRQSGQLRRYSIDVAVHDGTAEVSGMVADQPQREEALRIVQGVPGVEHVRDRLTLESSGVVQVQDRPRPLPPPTRIEPQPSGAVIIAPGAQEPMPIFQAPAGAAYDVNPPKMPPYAWPTYAPYNNLARVGYPEAYPYQAWPFIGPVYPFPKVPLGWRSVKLQFEDGHWWYSQTATKYDWWRVRYW